MPIAESEQYYIALKDVGVETVMVRYPREGHGLAEPGHIVDLMDRSLAFYEKQFARAGDETPGRVSAQACRTERPKMGLPASDTRKP